MSATNISIIRYLSLEKKLGEILGSRRVEEAIAFATNKIEIEKRDQAQPRLKMALRQSNSKINFQAIAKKLTRVLRISTTLLSFTASLLPLQICPFEWAQEISAS